MASRGLYVNGLGVSDLLAHDSIAQPQPPPSYFGLDGSSAPPKAGGLPSKPTPKPIFKIVILEQDIEKIRAADKKDRHSKTKICCYACCVAVPIMLLVILAMVIWYVIAFRPGEGAAMFCKNSTNETDTLNICRRP
jgi:hypothetical protein